MEEKIVHCHNARIVIGHITGRTPMTIEDRYIVLPENVKPNEIKPTFELDPISLFGREVKIKLIDLDEGENHATYKSN